MSALNTCTTISEDSNHRVVDGNSGKRSKIEKKEFEVVFLGTGVSTGIPCISHVLDKTTPCAVCQHALNVPDSKNKRNNVSIAITFQHGDEDKKKCILIDVGKTLRDACISQFPKHDIAEVHAILITHGHADAMMGLDDVRDLQIATRVQIPDPHHDDGRLCYGFRVLSGPLPIYCTEPTMTCVQNAFPYLTNGTPPYLDETNNILERRIALLNFTVIEEWQKLTVHDLPIQCFPVFHGGKYVSLGFAFGSLQEFVYISDVKIIPQQTFYYLKSIPKIKVLVVDALDMDGIWSHTGIEEAIDIVEALKPEVAYFTGIACGMGLHNDMEAQLQSRNISYHLAYDGLVISGMEM